MKGEAKKMTAQEIQKRSEKAEQLKVFQSDDGQFFVESGEGKILYCVSLEKGGSCTCGDFAKNIKREPNFKCKHILSVMNAIPKDEVENARFLERHIPQLDQRFVMQLDGKDFVKFAGLLDLGHQKGISQLKAIPLQYPTKENGNFAICQTKLVSRSGEIFIDVGDANPYGKPDC